MTYTPRIQGVHSPAFEDPNPERGLENAVRNGQQRLALDYTFILLKALRDEVEELKARIAEQPKAVAVKRTPKKDTDAPEPD